MKLAVLGATGPSGIALVKLALDAGHDVLALVRNPDKITTTNDKLQVHKVDLEKEETLVLLLEGCDAVLSCLGSPLSLFYGVTLYSDTIKVIISSMRKAKVNRFICITAWGSKYAEGQRWIISWVLRPIFLRTILADMSRMEDYLEAECSDINYTVVRPPGLTGSESTGKEIKVTEGQFVPDTRSILVSRQDVARFMLSCLQTEDWNRKMVAIIT